MHACVHTCVVALHGHDQLKQGTSLVAQKGRAGGGAMARSCVRMCGGGGLRTLPQPLTHSSWSSAAVCPL